jgi:hypothetical protein
MVVLTGFMENVKMKIRLCIFSKESDEEGRTETEEKRKL